MLTHQVLYKTNPENPDAGARIIEMATKLLAPIPQVRALNAGYRVLSHRAVMDDDLHYDVAITFNFDSAETEREYQRNPQHLEYVKFVLKGWMLEGSTAEEPEAEFIDHILNAPANARVRWTKNPAIPLSEIVWCGETVIQFAS